MAAAAIAFASACATTEASDNSKMAACDGFYSRVRQTPNMTNGVATCTVALAALDQSSPDNWTRRVSLLHARALHHLAAKDPAAALSDLDAADAAAVAKDAYYERSYGLNAGMIRALALHQQDKPAEAREIALKAAALRPYNRDTALAALSIVGLASDPEVSDKLTLTAVSVHPTLAMMAFRQFFETKRYEAALAIADQVRRPNAGSGSYTWRNQILSDELERKKELLFRLEVDGRKAFALAALGRRAEALAAVDAFAVRVAKAKVAVSSLPSRPTEEQRARSEFQAQVNDEIDVESVPVVDFWSRLVRARLALNAGDEATVTSLFNGLEPVTPTLAILDFFGDDPEAAKLSQSADMRVAATGIPPATAKVMFGFLQNLETREGVAQAIDPLTGLFMSQDDRDRGGCSEGKLANGLEKVCFVTIKSSPSVAEERAVLRAADKAIERGASSFVIESRFDVHTTIVSKYYGMTTGESDGGYESSLEIRFIQPGDADAKCFRCLNAADVVANLAPIYRPAPRKP